MKDAKYKQKYLKAEKRAIALHARVKELEREVRTLEWVIRDMEETQWETRRLQKDLNSLLRPTGKPTKGICLCCGKNIKEVNPFRRSEFYCSDGCASTSGSLMSYHRKKTGN